MEVKVSVITINYNGLDDTCALIDTIPFSDSLEVIVVDNGSARDEATEIERRYPEVSVVRSKENLGFAGGNNLGIKASRGRYVFLLNNDTILEGTDAEKQASIAALTDRLESSADIGAVCPIIRFAWNRRPIQFAGYTPLSKITLRNHAIGYGEEERGQYNTPHPTPYAHGAAMMVKREAIEKAGLMPECFFLYYEELDWSLMLRRAGYEIWYEPACCVYHKESQATGQDSPLKTYYVTRSRLLFAKRNLTGFSRVLSLLYLVCVAGLKGVLSSLLKGRADLAKATVRGIIDFTKL